MQEERDKLKEELLNEKESKLDDIENSQPIQVTMRYDQEIHCQGRVLGRDNEGFLPVPWEVVKGHVIHSQKKFFEEMRHMSHGSLSHLSRSQKQMCVTTKRVKFLGIQLIKKVKDPL